MFFMSYNTKQAKNCQNNHFEGVEQTIFFFEEKKVDHTVFGSKIYRGLL